MIIFNEDTTQVVWGAMELPAEDKIIQTWHLRDKIRWELMDLVDEPSEPISDMVWQISEDVKIRRAQELLALRSRPA